jgi:hypothetical protein
LEEIREKMKNKDKTKKIIFVGWDELISLEVETLTSKSMRKHNYNSILGYQNKRIAGF